MKLLSRLLPGAVSLGCLLFPVSSMGQAPVSAPGHFDAVAKHLQTGGVLYTVVDIDGDVAKFAAIGDGLLDFAKKEAGGALPPGLSATALMKSLGLDRLKAIGMSSKPAAGNLFHNRALIYLPEGRSGLFKLIGGAVGPLQSPAMAPAGSDIVMESEVTLSALLEIAESVLRSAGDEAMLQQYRGLLGLPMPGGLNMTAGDFIAKLNTRIIIAGRLEKDKSFSIPGSDITLPGFRLVVSFDNLDFLTEPLLTYAKHSADVTVETGGGYQIIKPKTAAEDQPPFLRPLFYHDIKSKRLLLGTHPDAVTEFLDNKTPLSADPAFVQAMAGLPTEANELSYLTPAVYQLLGQLFEEAVKAAPATSGGPDNAALQQIFGYFQKLSPLPTLPAVTLRANLPEGMLFLSNSTSSFKSILTIPAALATGLVGALGFGAYEGLMPSLKAKNEARNSEETAAEGSGGADDDKGVRHNLQQIAFAAQSFFVDKPGSTEVTYEQLIDAELLFKLDPVRGESYKGLKLEKAGGVLSLKLPGGSIITQMYGSAVE